MDLNPTGLPVQSPPVRKVPEKIEKPQYSFAERSQSLGQSPAAASGPVRQVLRQERIDPQTGSAFRHYDGS